MIKISKKYLSIYIFLLILLLALTGCSKNPVTDSYGPSWDMKLELPVTDQENNLGDLVEADEFENMGFTTSENEIDSLFVIGTEDKPIAKSLSLPLPELSANLGEGISVTENITIPEGNDSIPTIVLDFPDMTFGSSGNILTFSISNITGTQIDDLTIELWDRNAHRSNPLDTISFTELSSAKSKDLILNNKVIKEKNLGLRIKYDQSTGPVSTDITISGLKNITIKKVDSIKVTDADTPTFEDLTVELGFFNKIRTLDNGEARLELAINEPQSMNMDFDFSSITIAGVEGVNKGDYYQWAQDTDPNTNYIELGDVSVDGSVNLPDDNIISYDATDNASVNVSIVGKASYNSTQDELPEELKEIKVEKGDLIYETEPTQVDISQEDINTMREGVIDLEQTYLETIINNNTGIEMAAEIYIGSTNNKDNLYTSANKVNDRLLEVNVDQNDPKRFLLKNTIDKVEETLTEGNVYMGIKFIAGNLNVDTGTEFEFTKNTSISIKSSVFVKVRINQ